MKHWTPLTWLAVAASVALVVLTVVLGVLNLGTPTPPGMSFGPKAIELALPILLLAFPVVGALIVSQRPGHRIGGLYLLMGVAGGLVLFSFEYALYSMTAAPARLPAGDVALWLLSWVWAPVSALVMLPIALFPSGRLPSPRWRFVYWLTAVGAVLQSVGGAAYSYVEFGEMRIENPLGIRLSDDLSLGLFGAGSVCWALGALAAIAALVVRYRRSRADERQQIKWFAYGGGASALAQIANTLLYHTELSELVSGVAALSVLAIPVTTAIAISRYRLYDIDLLLNRTLVYGVTSATIAGTFFLGIIGLQSVLRPLTAGSELAVAASTLVSFALFQPVRRRVQHAVERRFDRTRYDAARTLDAFADRLRDEVDLDTLRSELLGAVRQTMAPTHASLWLRERAG